MGDGMDQISPKALKTARALWPRALSFLMSARELGLIQMKEAERIGRPDQAFSRQHAASFYLLLGFATELLLKVAYLVHGGTKPVSTFGHDLERVMAATEALGWSPYPSKLVWLVNAQQGAHKNFHHRYDTAPDEQLVPDIKEPVQILWDFSKRLEADFPILWSD